MLRDARGRGAGGTSSPTLMEFVQGEDKPAGMPSMDTMRLVLSQGGQVQALMTVRTHEDCPEEANRLSQDFLTSVTTKIANATVHGYVVTSDGALA
ncbi:hypothetical protein CYMTET_31025 [Cymbomonas tetramitiformis]|uniref:Uncharacterized protein n=1 Tax=Cymbomonas tetramitiformis TaxID=36881 RepID=A0AAE0FIC7_9CHLO|nr:hypothetical protein CYMTET_31025 [Cymbomonas tetramitiformis]